MQETTAAAARGQPTIKSPTIAASRTPLDGISGHGLALSRDMEVGVQCDAIVAAGPCGPLSSANLAISPAVGLPFFGNHVRVLYDAVC